MQRTEGVTDHKQKRTTIVLDAEDQRALRELADLNRQPEAETIRRSIRLARQLKKWMDEGGEVVLVHGDERQRLVFL
jgi:hypothetical protein